METSTTETPPQSPTAEIATVDSYPFNFEQTVTFDRADIYGWFFDGSFTKAADLALNVESGSSISVYLTEENLQQGKVPENSVKEKRNAKSVSWEAIEITDGAGSIMFETNSSTQVTLDIQITNI